MKILIVYYTRTNTTKRIAEMLAGKLNADLEEVVDIKNRSGIGGYIGSGRDAMLKKLTKIKECKYDPAAYDFVIIGTPVWAGTMSSAIRTYLDQYAEKIKKVAFFTTQGLEKRQRVFGDLKMFVKKDPIIELQLTAKEVVKDKFIEKLEVFAKEIKRN